MSMSDQKFKSTGRLLGFLLRSQIFGVEFFLYLQTHVICCIEVETYIGCNKVVVRADIKTPQRTHF